jgi:hypothetical protein
MVRLAISPRLLVLPVVLSTAACLAQGQSPTQLAAPSVPVQAQASDSSCQAIASGNPQLAPVAKLCKFALTYQQELPDFLAEMTVTEHRLRSTTVIVGQVGLNQGHEIYSATTVNGKPADADNASNMFPLSMRFTSSGEFGAMLVDLFHPNMAEFQFRKQATLNGTRAMVYDFHISALSNTFWRLTDATGHTLHPELRGELWIDTGTGRVMREIFEPVHLPSNFEITKATTSIDYAETIVGEAGVFLLASRSESNVCTREPPVDRASCVANVKTFRNYRKFAATTRILADAPQQ